MKAKVIVENSATTTCRWSSKEPQPSNTPKVDWQELIDLILERACTDEFMNDMSKRIQEENERYEAYEREQRMLWHKHKNDVYDI